ALVTLGSDRDDESYDPAPARLCDQTRDERPVLAGNRPKRPLVDRGSLGLRIERAQAARRISDPQAANRVPTAAGEPRVVDVHGRPRRARIPTFGQPPERG